VITCATLGCRGSWLALERRRKMAPEFEALFAKFDAQRDIKSRATEAARAAAIKARAEA
jgi:hypothetical protein